MIHKDDEENAGSGMFIADHESNFVIESIAPRVADEKNDLKEMAVGTGTISWIVAEGIVDVGDGIVDEIIEPTLRFLR